MAAQNLVAVFKTHADADEARKDLLAAGISSSDIQLSATQQDVAGVQSTPSAHHQGGFLNWLFGDAPEEDRNWYGENLRDGRTALSVHVQDDNYLRVQELLEDCGPLDIEREGSSSAATTLPPPPRQATVAQSTTADQVIPVVKEELEIGKRQTERRFRVRAYAVSRPVEASVTLRDERVVVERRPVSGATTGVSGGLQDREFEVIETHEEPVVAKTARTVEEVVIHREAAERVETIHETVRETKVDVEPDAGTIGERSIDRAAAGNKPLTGTTLDERTLGERPVATPTALDDDAEDLLPGNRAL